jgi:hypothetical protein
LQPNASPSSRLSKMPVRSMALSTSFPCKVAKLTHAGPPVDDDGARARERQENRPSDAARDDAPVADDRLTYTTRPSFCLTAATVQYCEGVS